MKPTVYIETTIIGYLAMRLSAALRTAAMQQTTRDWWDNERHNYELAISRFVIEECTVAIQLLQTSASHSYKRCLF